MDTYDSIFVTAADGLRLHARDYGARHAGGLPVICLPGLTRSSGDFHDLAVALAGDARRPRRVVAPDYRGRGRSDYDRNWKNYDVRVELGDTLHVMTALGIERAIFVGTSRGGIITMAMTAARPGAIAGAVLNDIGAVIETKGLIRIRGYVGKMPAPRTYEDAVGILKALFSTQFPRMADADWDAYARLTWKQEGSTLKPDYDPALMKPLKSLDLERPLPPLWPYFDGLRTVPVLSLRGANSDLLSEETVALMAGRHPGLETYTVPDQGHAPHLTGRDVIGRIQRFIARCDAAG